MSGVDDCSGVPYYTEPLRIAQPAPKWDEAIREPEAWVELMLYGRHRVGETVSGIFSRIVRSMDFFAYCHYMQQPLKAHARPDYTPPSPALDYALGGGRQITIRDYGQLREIADAADYAVACHQPLHVWFRVGAGTWSPPYGTVVEHG